MKLEYFVLPFHLFSSLFAGLHCLGCPPALKPTIQRTGIATALSEHIWGRIEWLMIEIINSCHRVLTLLVVYPFQNSNIAVMTLLVA